MVLTDASNWVETRNLFRKFTIACAYSFILSIDTTFARIVVRSKRYFRDRFALPGNLGAP